MDLVAENVVTPLKDFTKNSVRLLNKCTKPDRKGTSSDPGTCSALLSVSRRPRVGMRTATVQRHRTAVSSCVAAAPVSREESLLSAVHYRPPRHRRAVPDASCTCLPQSSCK